MATMIARAVADAGTPENNLLRSLRPDDRARLESLVEPRDYAAGTVFYEPGDQVEHVYFPCGPALVSFMVTLEDGNIVETALIGREGAVGGIVSQGRLPAYARAVVQFPGTFLRLRSSALEEAKAESPALRHLFARYADCVMAQIFQSVACNAAHSIERRTAKWLVSAMDRTGSHDVPLTQEQLASMLGVGRSYISRIILSLKAAGILETRRGGVRVTSLERLQGLACGCNDAVRAHFDEVLRGVYPTEAENADQNRAAGREDVGSRMQG